MELRYRKDLEPALRDVSQVNSPGDHIGICGRTGAGKSSPIQRLSRLYELQWARFVIDDVEIKVMHLYYLPSALGVIPQQSICLLGTVLSDLEMFDEHDDDNIERALYGCGLRKKMREAEDVDFEIAENC